ncbi:MAG: hypothetical protein K2X81_08535, partial [Candidatus Obscuribacterales bacterium]|nr:hypothetical protein [Candidatus Obscuribacterales bacterium]
IDYRNLVIYSVYVRSHSASGTFAEVEKDLPRIKDLGVDIVWFLPIHPIGQLNKKGSLGCPYSISDYTKVNPEYGTLDDFARLVRRAHELGLKVMIDVVYNHTSHDSVYLQEHPEWYHKDANGKATTTVPEWSDIIDLNFGSAKTPNKALWDSLISALKQWISLGVDGFRCDVASIVPLEFWLKARKEIEAINPNTIWLAESVHAGFVVQRRNEGRVGHSDSELYQAFDITYDYDIWEVWRACAKGAAPLHRYLEFLLQQESIYPANYCKMRFVENHDQARIFDFAASRNQALAWTAFQCFNRGAFLIYAGQESAATQKPSLFEAEPVNWGSFELQPFLTKLAALKKQQSQNAEFLILHCESYIQATWQNPSGENLYGIFNVHSKAGNASVQLADGKYKDVLSEKIIEVSSGEISAPESVFVLAYEGKLNNPRPYIPPVWHFKIE